MNHTPPEAHERRPSAPWRRRSLALALALSCALVASDARADPEGQVVDASPSWGGERSLLQHFGVGVARALLGSEEDGTEPASSREDALRGVERAAAIGSPEAIAALVKVLHEASRQGGLARTDATLLLMTTRALAPFAAQRAVARAFASLLLYNPGIHVTLGPAEEVPPLSLPRDENRRARLELARDTAAVALAQAGSEDAVELLLTAARRAGPGRGAATRALVAFPPAVVSAPPAVTVESIALLVALGDVRAADAVLEAAGSAERAMRIAGLLGVAALGDGRGLTVAEALREDPDPLVREAATEALVALGARDAAKAVRRLIESDATVWRGVALSARVSGEEIVGALAARIRVSADLPVRRAATTALGRQGDAQAVAVLADLLSDPLLAGDAAEAIGRSVSVAAWPAIAAALSSGSPSGRRLGARMAALRGRAGGSGATPRAVLGALRGLARAPDARDRATATLALLLLGETDPVAALEDPDVRVRRAAAMASDPALEAQARPLGGRLPRESDPLTRALLARGLAFAGATSLTTTALLELARGGGIDAPVATLALAREADERLQDAVDAAIRSSDPILRSQAARGLGQSFDPRGIGRLAEAYDAETDPGVRLAIVSALGLRGADGGAPLRARTLERAARFDPEPGVRVVADRARRGLPVPDHPRGEDVLWLRVMTSDGKPPPPPLARGVLVGPDGLALPVFFDEDGYALVPAKAGDARLVLAPRLAPYEASPHGDSAGRTE